MTGAKRILLPLTRRIIHSIIDGSIEKGEFDIYPYFNIKIPKVLPGIDSTILNPLHTWSSISEFHIQSQSLVKKFQKNYNKYDLGDSDISSAGPKI